jgi:hypothetical protein
MRKGSADSDGDASRGGGSRCDRMRRRGGGGRGDEDDVSGDGDGGGGCRCDGGGGGGGSRGDEEDVGGDGGGGRGDEGSPSPLAARSTSYGKGAVGPAGARTFSPFTPHVCYSLFFPLFLFCKICARQDNLNSKPLRFESMFRIQAVEMS